MDRESLAVEVQRLRLSTTQLRAGYAERDVDALLDDVVAMLRDGEPGVAIAEHVRTARFTTTTLRRGYRVEDVDDALGELAERLDRVA